MNRKAIYELIKAQFGSLTTKQVSGFEAIFDQWEISGLKDIRFLAYILATVWHETGYTMQPIKEYTRGRGRKYGGKIKMSGAAYTTPDHIYYGRGHVQLTWYENYANMGKLLGVDLLNNPDLALDMEISLKILFEGMTKGKSSFGDFTGKSLEMYFNATTDNPKGARMIINGTDRATLIAEHHEKFLIAITCS